MRRYSGFTRVCVTMAITCLGTTASLEAQGTAAATTDLLHDGTVVSCSDAGSGQTASASILGCSGMSIDPRTSLRPTVSASADNGLLQTNSNSYIDGYNNTDKNFNLRTSSSSSWNDVLHVTAPSGTQVASVGVSISADGYYYVTGNHDHWSFNPGTGNSGSLVFNMALSGNGLNVTNTPLATTQERGFEAPSYQEYGENVSNPIGLGNMYNEFSFAGSNQMSLGWSFSAFTDLTFAPTPYDYNYNGEPTMPEVVFAANGGLGTLRFFDENHNDITNQVQYNFDNGSEFYASASVTPEPTSLALLGTGLVGLIPVLRRRRAVRR